MSACAHHRVTIDVYGPSSTILVTASLYCSDDAKGAIAVKAWARAEAKRLGIKLGAWDYVRHDRSLEWDGRVYGEPTKARWTRPDAGAPIEPLYEEGVFADDARRHGEK